MEPIRALERIPPHAVREKFLDAADHEALLAWTLAQEEAFVPSTVGAQEVRPGIRSSLTLRSSMLARWRPLFRARIKALLPELCTELGVQPFAMSRIEVQLIAYRDGAFYARHRDISRHEAKPGVRVVSAVYYFHAEPKGYAGGELRLFPAAEGATGFVDFAPRQNALIAFPSWAPHEVRPVACPSGRFADSRFAVNCWVHLATGGG